MSAPQPPDGSLPTADPPVPQPSVPQQSAARKWGIPFAVVGTIVLVIVIASSMSSGSDTTDQPVQRTQLESAREFCTAGVLADGGHTLVVDMAGEEINSGAATFGNVECLLTFLDTPTSVTSKMDKTRALDGMQDATWGDLSASWTYHPDAGMDITITGN